MFASTNVRTNKCLWKITSDLRYLHGDLKSVWNIYKSEFYKVCANLIKANWIKSGEHFKKAKKHYKSKKSAKKIKKIAKKVTDLGV